MKGGEGRKREGQTPRKNIFWPRTSPGPQGGGKKCCHPSVCLSHACDSERCIYSHGYHRILIGSPMLEVERTGLYGGTAIGSGRNGRKAYGFAAIGGDTSLFFDRRGWSTFAWRRESTRRVFLSCASDCHLPGVAGLWRRATRLANSRWCSARSRCCCRSRFRFRCEAGSP